MKKLLIAIIILLLIIIFLLLYCNCKKGCKKCDQKPGQQTGFCKNADCYAYNGETPAGMINFELAKKMTEDYARDIGKNYIYEGNIRTDSLDSRCIWFDLKKIKQFIAYTEQSLCKNNCTDSTSLGIRFYYAKYPFADKMTTATGLGEVPRNFARRHTLFMVPTYWDPVKGKNVDFDPAQVGSNCRIIPLGSPSLPYPGRVYGAALGAGDGGDAQNHGSLRPPPAGTGGFPEY